MFTMHQIACEAKYLNLCANRLIKRARCSANTSINYIENYCFNYTHWNVMICVLVLFRVREKFHFANSIWCMVHAVFATYHEYVSLFGIVETCYFLLDWGTLMEFNLLGNLLFFAL